MKKILKDVAVFPLLFLMAAGCTNLGRRNDQVRRDDQIRRDDSSVSGATTAAETSGAPQIIEIAKFRNLQVAGVTATDSGRLFASFPRWRDDVPVSVVEIMQDGSSQPYPNSDWNTWNGRPADNHFTCVQSVVASGNSLFVLDPSSPKMKGVVGQATLYEFDLGTNSLKRKWSFDASIAPKKSYLNDLRIDDADQKAYMTDSGLGAIVVLDLQTGKARRLLADDKSTKSELVLLKPAGHFLTNHGIPMRINSDGIALRDGILYFHALTGYHLYRIPTAALNDESLTSEQVSDQVEDMGKTPAPDGMIFDSKGNLYMADLENNSIVYLTPAGELKTLVQDDNLIWPDTFTIDPKGGLIFTDSKLINVMPGKPISGDQTFSIYEVPLAQ
jgi:sugar lactone lactonase YvrE